MKMYGEESQICKEAVKVFGKEQQTMMFIEECGELFQAISKHRRGFGSKDNIIEEIADVEIMLEQLKYVYKCHREGPIRKNWAPFEVCMPLIDEIIDNNEVLKKHGIKQPRLYDMNFSHNNCKGRCVKAGQGHFKNLREKMPDVFQELKEQEHYLKQYVSSYHYIKSLDLDDDIKEAEFRQLDDCYRGYLYEGEGKPKVYVPPHLYIKNYSFMKKQNGPYQLKDLDRDMMKQSKTCQLDLFDIGGCSCFVEFD